MKRKPVLVQFAAGAAKLLALLAKIGFIEYKFTGVTERVFQRQVFFHKEEKAARVPVVIPGYVRVFTSIEGNDYRANGEDAIRIQGVILDDPAFPPIEMTAVKVVYNAKVLRTKANICKRVHKRAKLAWQSVASSWQEPNVPWEKEQPATVSGDRRVSPTQKQRDYYKALTQKDLPADCNMKQASELISQAKDSGAKPQGTYTGPRRKRKGSFRPADPAVKAKWTQQDATPAQLRYLEILKKKLRGEGIGVEIPAKLSRGEASKHIDELAKQLKDVQAK